MNNKYIPITLISIASCICTLILFFCIREYSHDAIMRVSFLILSFLFFFKIMKSCFVDAHYNFFAVLYIVAVFFILLFPLYEIDTLTQDTVEKRTLATKPLLFGEGGININFGKDTEQWLGDHFYQRATIIELYTALNTWLEQKATGKITNEKAFIGKDDWIFLKAENSVANFQNATLFSHDELIAIEHAIEARKKWLEQYGIAYYVFIAPDKNRVYPEYYPDGIFKVNNIGRVEQLQEFLDKREKVHILYPYQELLNHKNEGLLYWKTDTHWNEHGGFIGYTVLMNAINRDFPDITPLKKDDFTLKEEAHLEGDVLSVLYPVKKQDVLNRYRDVLYTRFTPKQEYDFIFIKNEGTSGIITSSPHKYKVLVFRDSFTIALLPYLSQTFGDVEYIWSHNMNAYADYIVEKKPDIVIFEMVERYTHSLAENILPKEE